MQPTRRLIVNADDFGQSSGVNRGIIAAHERGIVTSASLMVRWPAAAEAAGYGKVHPRLAVGLHLDLGEWVYRDGSWTSLYEVVPLEDAAAVAGEVDRQFDAFRRLVAQTPTHVDSHQHVHLREPALTIVRERTRQLGVPLRKCTPHVDYCGNFYGQTSDGSPLPEMLTVEALVNLLRDLRPGITELGCHPGEGDDLDSMYRAERAREVEILCDSRIREALSALDIQVCSFRDLAGSRTDWSKGIKG